MDTRKVLQAALAYADALIEDGASVHVEVAGGLQNLALIPHVFLDEAVKGHPEHLQARRAEIAAALASLEVSEPVESANAH